MSLLGRDQIVPTLLEDEMQNSYLDYSMSVIVSRALPDIRDGLKPVHRRILYSMQDLGMQPNRAYKKSARLVGEVLGKYHPHGDSSVYDAMVRLAQEWSMRYPLVDGQGNYGSVDGDPPAAMRYTECRMASLSTQMLRDIDKNTVDYRPNFDESLEEPTVLPAVVPNLLVNGSSGIAVGMATNMPPHNLREISKALVQIIDDPDVADEALLETVPGPDFPTGGIIYGISGIKDAYTTGRGRVVIRARVNVEENKTGSKQSLVITELPYQVNKANLIEKIAHMKNQKSIDGIVGINDESDRDGTRVVIDLRRDAIPLVVLNNLYKHTQMQVTFGVINLALVNGRPKVLTLRQILQHYIDFRNEVIIRRTQFELDAAEKRAHILEGFIIALDNIDEVIRIIRESKDPQTASTSLQTAFELSEIQAKAILEMRLQRLTGLERDKIIAEYKEVIQTIEKLKSILASKALQMSIIKEELLEITEKYGDERRSEIVKDATEFTLEDMIADEDVVITISKQGLIKRTKVSNYRRQNKGGRGSSGVGTRDEDFVEHLFQASTHHYLLFFTDKGRVYRIKVFDIPEGSRQSKGRSIANVIQKQPDENITAYISVKEFTDDKYIIMCTKNGTVKKSDLMSYNNIRQNGIIAINLNDDDSMIRAEITDGNNEVILATRKGMACRFLESDVRSMGRTATGVRGINLAAGDYVVSMVVIRRPDEQVIVVAEKGYGKRTKYEDFRLTKRGGKGVRAMNVTNKTGELSGVLPALDSQDLMVITQNGVLIRQSMSEIRTIGRNTQGVRLIRLDAKDSIADITIVSKDEGNPEEGGGVDETDTADGQATLL
jgi:DNA gyrase subunit A